MRMRILAVLILAGALHAQKFEAASIHPNPGGTEGRVVDFEDSGLLRVSNASLKMLIRSAYGVQNDQIIGGPKWLDSDRYDIEAKTGIDFDANLPGLAPATARGTTRSASSGLESISSRACWGNF
jgi:hypothetical protein